MKLECTYLQEKKKPRKMKKITQEAVYAAIEQLVDQGNEPKKMLYREVSNYHASYLRERNL